MELAEGSIMIFKNGQKKTDKHPSMKGTAMCKCDKCGQLTEQTMSLWPKSSKSGNTYLSGSIKPVSEDPYLMSLKEKEKEKVKYEKLPPEEKEKDLPF